VFKRLSFNKVTNPAKAGLEAEVPSTAVGKHESHSSVLDRVGIENQIIMSVKRNIGDMHRKKD
jgi:hypothetical protein